MIMVLYLKELSSKIVINNKENNCNNTILIGSLGNYFIRISKKLIYSIY